MKLSEVIKVIEDGSGNKFTNGSYEIVKHPTETYLRASHHNQNVYCWLPLDGWEEVKPPRQWSEKELMLFKLLPDWAKWIAIDNDGSVWVFEEKPYLDSDKCYDSFSGNLDVLCNIFGNILTITFEESPVYIGDLKGE